jgi:septal ring factor EnvC (AmiA/AmiB activator)
MYLRSTLLCSFSIFLFFFSYTGFSQKSKSQLEDEKRQNLKKIAEAEKILSETASQKKATLGQLNAINQQISARESLIKSISEEIELLNNEIKDLNQVSTSLDRDLKALKEEYAEMIYQSYKANKGFTMLTFIFSSSTFNQLFQRLKYLEQYSEARKVQAQQIEIVANELENQLSLVENKRLEQKKLLDEQIAENRKLKNLKNRQNSIVAELSKKEKQIREEVAERKKSIERLDKLIADIIKKELEKAKNVSSAEKADDAEMTVSFEQNKSKLPWPVSTGFISTKFGRHPHPVFQNIMIDYTGIEIQTNKNQDVACVFDGEVKMMAFVPTMNNIVIVKHGTYYTVYSRLKEVYVEKGQILKASDRIGKASTNSEGVTEVHFEVWKNTQKLDPEKWLAK